MKVKELAELLGVTEQNVRDRLRARGVEQQNGVATEVDEQTAKSIVIASAINGNKQAYKAISSLGISGNDIIAEIVRTSNAPSALKEQALSQVATSNPTVLGLPHKMEMKKNKDGTSSILTPERKIELDEDMTIYTAAEMLKRFIPDCYSVLDIGKMLTRIVAVYKKPRTDKGDVFDEDNYPRVQQGTKMADDVVMLASEWLARLAPKKYGARTIAISIKKFMQVWKYSTRVEDRAAIAVEAAAMRQDADVLIEKEKKALEELMERTNSEEEPNDWAWNLITSRANSAGTSDE